MAVLIVMISGNIYDSSGENTKISVENCYTIVYFEIYAVYRYYFLLSISNAM